MLKVFKGAIALGAIAMATSAFAAPTVFQFVVEDHIQDGSPPFTDSAFEPSLITIDGSNVYFGENNRTTGNQSTTIYSNAFTDDPLTDASTQVVLVSNQDFPASSEVRNAIFAQTGVSPEININIRPGGDTDGTTLFVSVADEAGTSEFVGGSDHDFVIGVNIGTGAVNVISTTDGVSNPTLIGGTLFLEGLVADGAAQDAIYSVSAAATSAAATVVTGIASPDIAAALGGASSFVIDSLAATAGGDLLIGITDVDGVGADDRVLRVTDPNGSPSLSTFLSSAELDASSLGDVEPAGLATTASGYTVVLSAFGGGLVVFDAGESTSVLDAIDQASVTSNVRGATSPNIESFNDNLAATDNGGVLDVYFDSQDNEESIWRVTWTGVVPVEMSVFSAE